MGKRILFILKKRELNPDSPYGEWNSPYARNLSTGLFNSVMFIKAMYDRHIRKDTVKVVQVQDNNFIDREVNLFKPDIVVIEALWVVPEKFDVLHRLHPKVDWVIRLHSETPFLAQEGIAMDWLHNYIIRPRVHIGANSLRIKAELEHLLKRRVIYLPNYYGGDSV